MTATDLLNPLKNQLEAAVAKIATLEQNKTRLLAAVGEEALKVQELRDENAVLAHGLREERAGHSAILGVLDDVERMKNHLRVEYAGTWVYDGARHIYENFEKALSKIGIEKIPCDAGVLFDPGVHEALAVEPGQKGMVVQVMRGGYKYRDGDVIQPVGVTVGSGE